MKFGDACTEATHQKVLLLHTALRARTLFGLDMSTSFFFRGSTFQTKFVNVLGINDKTLNEFQAAYKPGNTQRTMNNLCECHEYPACLEALVDNQKLFETKEQF